MQDALKSNEWQWIWVYKTFKIEIQGRGGGGVDQIIQTFCKIDSPQKLGPLSLICKYLKTMRKVLLHHAECIKI